MNAAPVVSGRGTQLQKVDSMYIYTDRAFGGITIERQVNWLPRTFDGQFGGEFYWWCCLSGKHGNYGRMFVGTVHLCNLSFVVFAWADKRIKCDQLGILFKRGRRTKYTTHNLNGFASDQWRRMIPKWAICPSIGQIDVRFCAILYDGKTFLRIIMSKFLAVVHLRFTCNWVNGLI